MADELTLSPEVAARAAVNSYFTLKDWIQKTPVAGVESSSVVQNRVLGSANAGLASHPTNSSLKGSGLKGAQFGSVHAAKTGFGTSSGFGYTLTFEGRNGKQVLIATRGTRPEMGTVPPDVLTDIRAAMTPMAGYGLVHKGFKVTYDSIKTALSADKSVQAGADVYHCVGHSLGGGVATLIAAGLAANGKNVKLYTFGCPRVGAFETYSAIQQRIKPENIYRVAHDLDPFTHVAPFPYVHVLPSPTDDNNITMPSPTGQLLSTANHDMETYMKEMEKWKTWDSLRLLKGAVEHDDALVVRWFMHEDNNPGWVQYASAKTLALIFKIFRSLLRSMSTSLFLGLSIVDFLAEILVKGLHKLLNLGDEMGRLLQYAATWAGIKVGEVADFTGAVIRAILAKMLSALRTLAAEAVAKATRNLLPVALGVGGAMALSSYGVL